MILAEQGLKWGLMSVLFWCGVAQATDAPEGLEKAFAILEKSEVGKQLLEDAREQDLSIQEGKISKTEIVATRIVRGKTEKLEFRSQVLISKDKNPVFQAIDLAHELVHALHPKTNPFDPRLNAVDYIRQGIESEGGEAQAILQECKVGQQLTKWVPEEEAQLIKARCQFVWHTEKDKSAWKKSFYHLGRYFEHFLSKLDSVHQDSRKNGELTRIIQPKDPLFTSAAANKPYPLALLDEYVEITKKICNHQSGRKIASTRESRMEERCQSLSSALFTK